MQKRKPFLAYLTETRSHAAGGLMVKARDSNRLAKVTDGSSQRRLYELKHCLISRALEVAPEVFVVDYFDLRYGLVGLQCLVNGVRLHAPAARLSFKAKAVVSERLLRVIHNAA